MNDGEWERCREGRHGRRRQTVLVILIRRIQFAGGKLRLLTTAADSDGPALLLTTPKGERANVLNMYLICRALRVFFGAAFRHARARARGVIQLCVRRNGEGEGGGSGRGRKGEAWQWRVPWVASTITQPANVMSRCSAFSLPALLTLNV